MLVGFDISLQSPAMCLYTSSNKEDRKEVANHGNWHWYAFQQQQVRAPRLPFPHPTIHLLPPIPTASTSSNMDRYKHIVDHFLGVLSGFMKLLPIDLIGIEGPAPNSQIGNAWKLGELCGIFKWELLKLGIPQDKMYILAPNTWKKFGVENHQATKLQTLTYLLTHGPCIDILRAMNQHPNANGDVPTPSQDIGDATGIVLALMNPNYHNSYLKKCKAKQLKRVTKKEKHQKQPRKKNCLQSAVTLLIEKQRDQPQDDSTSEEEEEMFFD